MGNRTPDPTYPFEGLTHDRDQHFRLYFYAAILHLRSWLSHLGPPGLATEQFPFLARYFNEFTTTPVAELRPDVLVKGADYAREQIVGAREVESWGGRVVRVAFVPGYSTTELLARFRREA